jgi:triosephosphate isomerase
LRKPLIAGNWKMSRGLAEAVALAEALKPRVAGLPDVDVAICPPFTALAAVGRALAGTRILLGGQDLFWEAEGAFTGEISGPMLRDAGCQVVLVGHSERRQILGESDGMVNRKARAALGHGLVPIVCLGETLLEREQGQTLAVIERQLAGSLEGIRPAAGPEVVLAYEPVWAIGTGRTATPAQANEVHAFMRGWLRRTWGAPAAEAARLLYGGSVKPDNIKALMDQPDVDGALVGGASLDAGAFAAIVKYRG